MVKLRPCKYPLKTQNRSANTKVKNGVGFPSRIRRGKMSALYQTKKRKFIVLTTKKEIVLKSKHCPHYPTFEILSTSPWCLFERISALALTPKTLIFFCLIGITRSVLSLRMAEILNFVSKAITLVRGVKATDIKHSPFLSSCY